MFKYVGEGAISLLHTSLVSVISKVAEKSQSETLKPLGHNSAEIQYLCHLKITSIIYSKPLNARISYSSPTHRVNNNELLYSLQQKCVQNDWQKKKILRINTFVIFQLWRLQENKSVDGK